MSTFRFNSLRDSIRVEAMLTRPILDWERTAGRFFGMIYDALTPKISITTADFTVQPAAVIADVRAKYSIYGGAASVSLHADRLMFDFPNSVPAEYPIITQIMISIHDAFPKAFPELSYERMEVQSLAHLDLLEDGAVELFLDRYKISGIDTAFSARIVSQPAVRFTAVSEDQNWQCAFAAERSALSATGLFTIVNVSLRNVTASTPFQEKAGAVIGLMKSCLTAVGLENTNAATT